MLHNFSFASPEILKFRYESVFGNRPIVNKEMKKKLYASGFIVLSGVLAAIAIFAFSVESGVSSTETSSANSPIQWTQESGVAVSVPACASSAGTGSPITCQGGAPSVQFSFSGLERHLETIRLEIFQGGSMVAEQILCGVSGSRELVGTCPDSSYVWTGGRSDQSYTWRLIHAYAGQVIPESGAEGSFSTPNCQPQPQLPDLIPGNPSIQ